MSSITAIPGLQLLHPPSDEDDVHIIDSLTGNSWHITACWLKSAPTISTRQRRLNALARFLRWLNHLSPGIDLLSVDESHLIAYRDALTAGTATGVRHPGQPLKPATIAWHLAMLSSLFRHALCHCVINVNPAQYLQRPIPSPTTPSITSTLTFEEHHAIVAGIQALAATHPKDAAAVALLTDCLLRASELIRLTVNDIIDTGERLLITVSRPVNGTVSHRTVSVPVRTLALLKPLRTGRAPDELLLTKHDGRPIDRCWLTTALRNAALAGGIPADRVLQLHPKITRPTAIALLEHETSSPEYPWKVTDYASPGALVRHKRQVHSGNKHPLYGQEGSIFNLLDDLIRGASPPEPPMSTPPPLTGRGDR
ncbi:tyrosine-type recombinase/integrase [Streptosporangium sp. NPDC000563]|uniref:tyrosine-type recombinase/integrase n=1 Tax=Streptosporangium sp. NPDC000563 TaxID=3154366 RepID=UPI0033269906